MPIQVLIAEILAALETQAARAALTTVATDLIAGQLQDVFDSDEIVPALQVLNETLKQIDQAIVDGFAGRDIQLERLKDVSRAISAMETALFHEGQQIQRSNNPNSFSSDEATRGILQYGDREFRASGNTGAIQEVIDTLREQQSALRDSLQAGGVLTDEIAGLEEGLTSLSRQLAIANENGNEALVTRLETEISTLNDGMASFATRPEDRALAPTNPQPLPEELANLFTVFEAQMRNINDPVLPTFTQKISEATNALNAMIELADQIRAEQGELPALANPIEQGAATRFGIVPVSADGSRAGLVAPTASDGEATNPVQLANDVDTRLIPAVNRTTDAMANMITGLARDGEGAMDAMNRAAFSILDDFTNQIFSQMAQSLGPLGGVFSSLFSNLLGGVFGFAGGGAIQPGVPILVGERGPELFIPAAPGRIANRQDSRNMLAGSGPTINITQNVNFDTALHNDMTAQILAALPAIKNVAADEVMNRLRGIRYR